MKIWFLLLALVLSAGCSREAPPPAVPDGLNLTVAGQPMHYPVENTEVWSVVAEDPENPQLTWVVRGKGATLVVPFPKGTGHSGTELRWNDLVGRDLAVAAQGKGPSDTENSGLDLPGQSTPTAVTGGTVKIEAVEGSTVQGRLDLQTAGGAVPGTFRVQAPATTSD